MIHWQFWLGTVVIILIVVFFDKIRWLVLDVNNVFLEVASVAVLGFIFYTAVSLVLSKTFFGPNGVLDNFAAVLLSLLAYFAGKFYPFKL